MRKKMAKAAAATRTFASDTHEDCLPAEAADSPERIDSDNDVAGAEPVPIWNPVDGL